MYVLHLAGGAVRFIAALVMLSVREGVSSMPRRRANSGRKHTDRDTLQGGISFLSETNLQQQSN